VPPLAVGVDPLLLLRHGDTRVRAAEANVVMPAVQCTYVLSGSVETPACDPSAPRTTTCMIDGWPPVSSVSRSSSARRPASSTEFPCSTAATIMRAVPARNASSPHPVHPAAAYRES